ncbi:S-layer homology domain-containing protein [Chlorogloeopsis sp. ULAP01]|uniref:S-layer homology domain-containing protein n=1 Tax=Chlorogloeopsis sp. ULAP01 TaxID=3056483 RepID=UPI0025AA422A|nr:S-layer homology domain-containing protein [Chlorogloeopsis sp. ULAP01]MDM9382995.1 S-layer homology domain-containing protein [Chlorogloeopsis sp. ULAP01]
MTNMPPDPKSSQTNVLGFDEFIGILVAFASIGAVLFWSFFRNNSDWNLPSILLPSSTLPATPAAPSKNTPPAMMPLPSVAPSELPRGQTPLLPSSNPIKQFPLVIPTEKKSTIPPPIAFTDVPNNFWARGYINALSSRNIIKGYQDNSFRPNQPVTRAEFAAILQQAFENELGKTKNKISFQDVPNQFWANSAIDLAISTGFLKGYPDNTFKAQKNIPRVQVLVALASGLHLNTPTSPTKILNTYQDAKEIPAYARNKVAAATENGLVINYPNPKVFAPNKEATRAEVAAMIHQALVLIGRLDKVPSQKIVQLPDA